MDQRIAAAARTTHGVLSAAQLHDLGLTTRAIHWRCKHGRLHRVHRGIYSVGHAALSREATWVAATLAVGGVCAIAGNSAARLWRISRWPERRIQVVVGRRHHGVAGVALTQSRSLVPGEVTVRGGVPVTTMARTLLDLAFTKSAHQVAWSIREAAYRELLSIPELHAVMERNGTRRGVATLGMALELYLTGSTGTRSGAEDRMLALVEAAGLPAPEVNRRRRDLFGDDLEVDLRWPRHRVCVEVDGPAHRLAPARRRDTQRDDELARAGWRVVRVRSDDVGGRAVARIAAALTDPPLQAR